MNLKLVKQEGDELPDFDQALRGVIRKVVQEELQGHSMHFRWLTTTAAGEILGISPAAVAARVRQGKLPGRLYQRRYYVDGEALDSDIAGSRATLPSLRVDPEQTIRGRARRKPPRP